MSYIIKNTAALINTLVTDAGRKKMSQGKFDISYFQVGDSEVCYDCVTNLDLVKTIYRNKKINERNRMRVKVVSTVNETQKNKSKY